MDLWLSCSLGCMGRGPLLSCLLKIHAIVGSTLSFSVWGGVHIFSLVVTIQNVFASRSS